MYPVLTKTVSKRIILQTGKTVCSNYLRYSSELPSNIELPPEPTTCCMSGCPNCVWIEYAQRLAKLLDGNCDQARQIVLNKIQDPNLKMFLVIELKNIQYNLEHNKTNDTAETEKDTSK